MTSALVHRLGRAALTLGLILAIAPCVLAEYTRLKLFELASVAEIVVAGEIVRVEEKAFELEVERWIVGRSEESTVRVRRFVDWTCAGRWCDYAVGQRVILFLDGRLIYEPRDLACHWIMGGGGEGELPLDGADVILREFCVHGVPFEVHELDGIRFRGSRVELDELAAAISGFRPCIEWEVPTAWPRDRTAKRTVSPGELEEFARTSKVARHLVESLISDWAYEEAKKELTEVPEAVKDVGAIMDDSPAPVWIHPGRIPLSDHGGANRFGSECSFIGDLDGDGIEELAVGGAESHRKSERGGFWLFFLNENGSPRRSVTIDGAVVELPNTVGFGSAFAPLGDLDGNGVPDLAVRALRRVGERENRGTVWILFLERDGSVKSTVELGEQPPVVEARLPEDDWHGAQMACVGDLDGDGVPELAIGQPRSFSPLRRREASLMILSLARDGRLRWVKRHQIWDDRVAGGGPSQGGALAGVGDLDGDGVPDLAIGAPYDDDGGEYRGAVWIVFLQKDGTVKGEQKISDWEGGFDGFLRDESEFGGSLFGPGDLDGDGVGELLVGSREGLWTLFLKSDGTVREHRLMRCCGPYKLVRGSTRSIACSRQVGEDGRRLLATGGKIGLQQLVWLLGLGGDGELTGW